MKLTLAEFGAFSLAAKSQILGYKASLVASISLSDYDLQLFCFGDGYIIKQLNRASGQAEKIYPVINSDMLYVFCKDVDISGLLAN